MCVAIPSKVVSIDAKTNTATEETMSVERKASLDLLEHPPALGDYIIIHVGFAMSIIDEQEALETIKLSQIVLDDLEKKEGS